MLLYQEALGSMADPCWLIWHLANLDSVSAAGQVDSKGHEVTYQGQVALLTKLTLSSITQLVGICWQVPSWVAQPVADTLMHVHIHEHVVRGPCQMTSRESRLPAVCSPAIPWSHVFYHTKRLWWDRSRARPEFVIIHVWKIQQSNLLLVAYHCSAMPSSLPIGSPFANVNETQSDRSEEILTSSPSLQRHSLQHGKTL